MAVLGNVNAPAAAPGAAPTVNTLTANAGPDTIPVQPNSQYLLRISNTGGAPVTVTIDDPTSTNPGNATAFNPDVPVAVTNAQIRAVTLNTNRHRDAATGNVTLAYSGALTGTIEVYGPYPL